MELSNIHTNVMRLLARGYKLTDICASHNLPFGKWQQIVESPLFKEELALLQEKQTLLELERDLEDPVLKELRKAELSATNRLVQEVDNFNKEEGATSTTRIRASESILNRIGYSDAPKQEVQQATIVQINITPGKAGMIQEKLAKVVA